MSQATKAFSNIKTTLIGAGAGSSLYLAEAGLSFPNSKQEWGAFVVSFLIFLLGAFSKDGSTGSRP